MLIALVSLFNVGLICCLFPFESKNCCLKLLCFIFCWEIMCFFFIRNLTDCYDYNLFRCRYKHFELVINYDTWNIHWSRSWKKNYLYRSVVYYLSLTRKILLSFWALSTWDDRVICAMDCHLTTCAFNFIIIIDKVDFFVLLITSRRVTFSLLISALRILNHTYHKC